MPTSTIIESDVGDELDSASLYEEVNGLQVEAPPMGLVANVVANRLSWIINSHSIPRGLGWAYVEVLFRLPIDVQRSRRPDVPFVSAQRWPMNKSIPTLGGAWELAPDLAIEVLSPTDLAEELDEKIGEYWDAGVRQIWVVHTQARYITVHESRTRLHNVLVDGELDGGDIIPGLRVPVGEIFPPSNQ